MSQSRYRPVVACIVGLVLLTSAGAVVAGPDQPTPVEPTADAAGTDPVTPDVDMTIDQRPAPESAAIDATAPLDAGSVGQSLSDVDVGSLDAADESLTRADLQTESGLEDGPLGPSGLLALAGYSRLAGDDPLDDPVRSRLYETVKSSPGIYPAALVDRLDTPRSTLRYHLRVLEDEGLVTVRSVDGKRRYVTADATAAERALSVVDEGTTAAHIVERLARDGSATVSELAARLDRSPGTVTYHLNRLEDAAVVERERDGQAVQNRLAPGVDPVVASVDTATPDPFRVATDD